MPTQVIDLERAAPQADIVLDGGTSGALALVRQHGRPVGLVRLRAHEGIIPAGRLQAALAALAPLSPDTEPVSAPPFRPVSIVVCSRERTELLVACLEALRAQAAAGHEVIVIDNAPLSGATAALASHYPYRYECEPAPGLNNARNRGVAFARHDIVAFTDDDCVPDPGWLTALTAPYCNPQVGATTGLVMPLELQTPAQEAFEAYCANRRIFRPRTFRAPHPPPAAGGVAGMGANMSFRRDLIQQLGGFDPRFDGGAATLSGGDTEMFARLLQSGKAIVYCPEALVWHRHPREMAAVRKVIFGYGVGSFAVFAKRLVEDRDWSVLLIAPRWLAGPPLKAGLNRLRGQPATPLVLVALEFWGALHGPWRFWIAHRAGKKKQ